MATLTHLEDEAVLVEEARKGNGQAFVTLMKQYDRRIYRLALSFLRNAADAEDVLQDVTLKAFTHLGGFRGDSRFFSWVARIATNECLMRLNRGRPRQHVSLDEPAGGEDGSVLPLEIEDWRETPEKACLKSELQAIVAQGMEKLDSKMRTVFLLRDVEQFSIEETAQMLGISAAAVKTRLFRARLRMREHMNAYFKKGK